MTTPHKCPVCDGSGMVWGSLPAFNQTDKPNEFTMIDRPCQHPCHACDGKGVVWAPATENDNPCVIHRNASHESQA